MPGAPSAPLTNSERPVSNSTGEKIPKGWAASTSAVSGSDTDAALAASAAEYHARLVLNARTNCW
ncbi:Uncharacterised protein [Mycobacterium tuberculosis]|nr:Uncharacterised protein [Mycobacterium tuberculosis]